VGGLRPLYTLFLLVCLTIQAHITVKTPIPGVIIVEVYHAVHGFASIDIASFLNYKDCYVQKTFVRRSIGNCTRRLCDRSSLAGSHQNLPSNPAGGRYPDGYLFTYSNFLPYAYTRSPPGHRRPGLIQRGLY
jgi:hypothetical protein